MGMMRSNGSKDMRPCGSLYRHFDASGRLLYVGQSLNHVARLESHKSSPWFWEIARVEVVHYNCPDSLNEDEIAAIRGEKPLYNKAHTKSRPVRRLSVKKAPPAAAEIVGWLAREGRKQRWLASQVYVTEHTLSRWLAGATTPGPSYRHILEEVTGLPVADERAWP